MREKWHQRLMWIVIGVIITAILSPLIDTIKIGISTFVRSNSGIVVPTIAVLAGLVIGGGIVVLFIKYRRVRRIVGIVMVITAMLGFNDLAYAVQYNRSVGYILVDIFAALLGPIGGLIYM